jgi:hypothetical protein
MRTISINNDNGFFTIHGMFVKGGAKIVCALGFTGGALELDCMLLFGEF